MSLNLDASEIVPKGIVICSLSTSGLTSIKKPTGFQYQPTLEQIRVSGFNSSGDRTPGIPQVVGRDYMLTLNYERFNPQIAAKLDDINVGENYFDFSCTFANTDNTTFDFSFAEPSLVINGQISLDPLGSMSLSFVATGAATFTL